MVTLPGQFFEKTQISESEKGYLIIFNSFFLI
jgi:hypothetical protein